MKTYLTVAELTLTPKVDSIPILHYYIKDEHSVTHNIMEAFKDIYYKSGTHRIMGRILPVSILEDIMNNEVYRNYLVSNIAFKLKERCGKLPLDFRYKKDTDSGYSLFSVTDIPEHFLNINENDVKKIEEYIIFQINSFIEMEAAEKAVTTELFLYGFKVEENRVIHEMIVEPSDKDDSDLYNESFVVGSGDNAEELVISNSLFLYGIDSNLSTDLLLEKADTKVMPFLVPNRYTDQSFFYVDHRLNLLRFRIVDVVRTDSLPSLLSKIDQHDNGKDYSEYRIVSKNGASVIITNNLKLIKAIPESIKKYNGKLPRTYYKIKEIHKVDSDTLSDKIFTELRIYNTREDDK